MRENSYLGAPSTVMTFLFVRPLALSSGRETKPRNCDITSFNGSVRDSLLSL